MSSLTELRQQVRFITRAILIVLVLLLAYRIVSKIFHKNTPTPSGPAPNVLFGKLPYPQFEAINAPLSPTADYELDLMTPDIPEFPDRLNVYELIPNTASLFGPDRAKRVAANYGFTGEAQQNSDIYSWTDSALGRTFQINIFTREFSLTFDWRKNTDFIVPDSIKSESQAENMAIGILQRSGIYPPELKSGTRKVTLLKLVGGELREVAKNETASLARVDFFRSEIDKLPVETPNNKQSPVSILLTNAADTNKQILSLDYRFWVYDYLAKPVADYPLKTGQQVWNEAQQGKATPVFFGLSGLDPNIPYTPQAIKHIKIKKISLGYSDSRLIQNYIQPIYILECEVTLEGEKKGDYVLYLPAITADWLSSPTTTTDNTSTPSQ